MKSVTKPGVMVIVAAVIFTFATTLSSYAIVPGANAGVDIDASGGNPSVASIGNLPVSDTSQDGRFVVFLAFATDLVSPSTTTGRGHVYVRDRLTNTTELISKSAAGVEADASAGRGRISEDGRYVVFESRAANLVSGDVNGQSDVFVRDRILNTVSLVSSTSAGIQGNGASFMPDVSADGNYVVWNSRSTNLVSSPTAPGGTIGAIYLKDLSSGQITLISQNSSGIIGNGDVSYPQISCEGRFITFISSANNLTSSDTYNPSNGKWRTYIVDRMKTLDPQYIRGSANGSNGAASVSCNGNYISFASTSTDLVAGDTNGKADVFLYDRIRDSVKRVSLSGSSTQSNGDTNADINILSTSVSNDGKYVVFESAATNLVSSDTNAKIDIFVRNTQANTTEIVSRDATGALSNGTSTTPFISSDGKYIYYYSSATNLVTGFTGMMYSSKSGADYDY